MRYAAVLVLVEQGHAWAQYELGLMHANGYGAPKDDAEAVKWYTKAAEQDYHAAQYNLCMMYAAGTGVPEDYVQAYKWLVLASVGTPDAKNLDRVKWKIAKRLRERLQGNMTEEQLAEANRLASEWIEKFKAKQDGD